MNEISIIRPDSSHWDAILAVLETANFQNIGGPEMAEFPLGDCFIALLETQVVGVAGYRVLDEVTAKTTLLTVHPDFRRQGIGSQLMHARLGYLRSQGIQRVYTNCDDPEVIAWNSRHFGFEKTGQLIPKEEDYGRQDKDHWVNLVTRL